MDTFASAAAEKAAYADYWSCNSGSFLQQGCYEWMARQLDSVRPKKVFDIGCGTGDGVLALFNRFGCDIISIDENLECLRRTHRLFRKNGVNAALRSRFKYRQNPDNSHCTAIEKSAINASERINLIQADVLFQDPSFQSYLQSQSPFDAVTIWLIGAYRNRESCADLYPLHMTAPHDYRLRVQNATYALASKILRPGGVLQVVDRGEPMNTKELEEEHLSGHREQAELGDLQVQRLTTRAYVENATSKGVSMVISPGTSGRLRNLTDTVLISVISVKPSA